MNDLNTSKKTRSLINDEIKKAKAACYHNQIEENAGNSKILWDTINQAMPRNKIKSNANIHCIKTENGRITDPCEIATAINKHFSEIGPKLAAKLPTGYKSFTDYITPCDKV